MNIYISTAQQTVKCTQVGILLTLSRFLVAFSEELHGFGCPQWRTKKPLSANILSKPSQYGGVGILNVRQLF